jgi:hypothetical protein
MSVKLRAIQCSAPQAFLYNNPALPRVKTAAMMIMKEPIRIKMRAC